MVESKVFEKYYRDKPIEVPLLIKDKINVYITKVDEDENGDLSIDCFYYEEDRNPSISHGMILFYTFKQIVEQVKIFSIDGFVMVNLDSK